MTDANGHYQDSLFGDTPEQAPQPEAEQEPRIRTKARLVPMAATEAIRVALGLSKAEFSHALGYSTSSGYSSATLDGLVSVKVELAAKGLYAERTDELAREENKPHFSLTIVEDGVSHTVSGVPPFRYSNGIRYFILACRKVTNAKAAPKRIAQYPTRAIPRSVV